MRELLFRGKSYDGEWVEGAYYKQTEYYGDAFEAHYIISSSDELEDNMMIYDRVIPKTVGQYTGLTDKNGKKIFEGDIVEPPTRVYSRNTRYEVCFDEDRRGWYPFACGDGCGCCESEVESPLSCEVIGNIHDNPDLLKGGDGK